MSKPLRIMVCYPNMKNRYGGNNMYYFLEELAKQAECKFVGVAYPDALVRTKGKQTWKKSPLWFETGEDISKLPPSEVRFDLNPTALEMGRKFTLFNLKRLYGEEDPDWILGLRITAKEVGREYKTCSWIGDVHVTPGIQIETSNEELDLVLLRNLHSRYVFKTVADFRAVWGVRPFSKWIESGHMLEVPDDWYISQLTTNYMFWPATVPPYCKPIPESEKKYDVSMIASVGGFYPLRALIEKQLPKLAEEHGWTALLKRPPNMNNASYRHDMTLVLNDQELRKQYFMGEDYARALAESKIFIFGNSIFNYPLSKYFEAMGSGALVLAPKPDHAEDLHFEPGRNFVEINADNWQEKLEYYLEDDQLRETIARHGHETAMKYHTNEVRVAETIKVMEAID